MSKPKDSLYRDQWHFALLGDIETIWNEYSGKGVKVGVYDSGVDYRHPDLAANYDASLNFRYNGVLAPVLPQRLTGPDNDGHGTSVAGLIAAARDGVGTVGVAWGAGITGVTILDTPFLDRPGANRAAFEHTAAFDIINASWGYTDSFDRASASDARPTVDGYDLAVATGRGGLGTIILHAAGNAGSNANGDPVVNPVAVIAVAATGRNGVVTDYSNYGANILVAAPAASVTTDLQGRFGYNTTMGTGGNYANDFGGTSAATPVVSGVVALMLDANPGLGWRDVREILATSASMPRSAVTGNAAVEVALPRFQQLLTNDSAPDSLDSDTWNDGGRFYSGDYGFGRVDAFAAVRLAEVWSILHGPAKTSQNLVTLDSFTDNGGLALDATSAAEPTLSFTVAATGRVEMIRLDLSLDSQTTQGGNWLVSLVSPTGSVYRLNYDRDKSQGNGNPAGDYLFRPTKADPFTWQFAIAHAIGENATGDWTIKFEPLGGGGTAQIRSVGVELLGSDPSDDNFHYVTADFRKALQSESANADLNPETIRDGVITDLNGGTDWLVMATLAQNVAVSLDAGGRVAVAGKLWATIGATTALENLVTGDGNDRLTGSGLANHILSMRGSDRVDGGAGQDTVDGGAGNDTVSGGAGSDLLLGGKGNDSLTGGDDGDRLSGGRGADLLDGGAGADVFVFGTGGGADTITGFEDGTDIIRLDDALWSNRALSASQVIDRFATVTDEGTLFTFAKGALLVEGIFDPHTLVEELSIF